MFSPQGVIFGKNLPREQVVGCTAETGLDEAGERTQNRLLAKISSKRLFFRTKYRWLAGVTEVTQPSKIKGLNCLTWIFGRTVL